MKALAIAFSALALTAGAHVATASAAPACRGDFTYADGGWVTDPACQRAVAQGVARSEGRQIARHPATSRQETRESFCLGNNDIRTDVYCAPYRD
jgi:hypothetical protein